MSRTGGKHEPASHFIRAWRQKRRLSLEKLADEIGMSHSNLGRIERGLVPLSDNHLSALAHALGLQTADIYRDPETADAGQEYVPIIGRVGANTDGAILLATGDRGRELVPVPPGGTSDAVAVLVQGHSMPDVAEDGSLIYFDLQRTPPTPEMLGRIVVVETEDERVLVKRLLRGSRKGLYDLESLVGEPIRDVRLRWAARIIAMIPPYQAKKIMIDTTAAA